ncbi:MAG TPA: DUF6677 family protein [Planctomycetota bacterium]
MVEVRPSERRGDATAAVLLTWFLPGAGHAYLGRVAFGALAFLVLEGLFLLGWWISEGRIFEYLDPELRGPFATLLAPEAGNLGAMLAYLKVSGFGALEATPFPRGMFLGSVLCAVSGLANLLLAAHAHLAARAPSARPPGATHPALLAAAAWLLPGLGHWLQGRRRRALLVAALLLGLFLLGTWLAEGSNLSRERHFYYWSGQVLLGGPALLLEALLGGLRVTDEIRWVDVGLLYGCMAGLLNVLAVLDVYGLAEQRWLGHVELHGGVGARVEGEVSA